MISAAAKGYMGLNLSTKQKKKRLTLEIKIQPIAILMLAILSALTNIKSWAKVEKLTIVPVVSANGLLVQKKLHPEENM